MKRLSANEEEQFNRYLQEEPSSKGRTNLAPYRKGAVYLKSLAAAYPPDKIVEVIERALELAEQAESWKGYAAVAQLLLEYTVGKPKVNVDVTHHDGMTSDDWVQFFKPENQATIVEIEGIINELETKYANGDSPQDSDDTAP